MNIKIFSRKNLVKFLQSETGYDVIVITEPDETYLLEDIKKLTSGELLHLEFDDVEFDSEQMRTRWSPPQTHHVTEALFWATGRDNIAVACMAGVSRSSAIAYAILSSRVGAVEAANCLEYGRHRPNKLITKITENILNDPQITSITDSYSNYIDDVIIFSEKRKP